MPKEVKVKDRVAKRDLRKVAEAVIEEYKGRKDRRAKRGIDKTWAEIDRQLRMEPELSHKQDSTGNIIEGLEWLPETELPLQAQTLEMLMADSRRLKFPRNRDWFTARAALTDKYLEAYKGAGSPIPGVQADGNEGVTQDDADRLAQAALSYWHSQYDFRGNVDLIDADAFKYGYGVGRIRKVRRSILHLSARQGAKDQKIPVLVPLDAKRVYLDDSQHSLMHEGEILGPNMIRTATKKLADLKAAAENDDSYLLDELKMLAPNKNGEIDIVELEGDLVVDIGAEVLIEKNVVVTAGIGKKDGTETHGLIRVQQGEGFSTYHVHEYQKESAASADLSSPLMKGMPIARVCAQIMNRLLEAGALKNGPPIGYNRDDPAFAGTGGPIIHPYAQVETTDPLQVYSEVGGDPSTLFEVFSGLVSLYTDVTGVNPARLGALTKSHTTAFAKDAELARGESRTVDFVNSTLEGPMTRLLELEYRMGLKDWTERTIYIEPWKEFAEIKRDHLPDIVKFVAIGAGAPAEEQARFAAKFESAQAAVQFDLLLQQQGKPPTIDVAALQKKILEEGGWTDVTEITFDQEGVAETPAETGQLPGLATASGTPTPI